MKYYSLLFISILFAVSAYADTNISASKVSLYQSEANNPSTASWYENGFDVGSYSKNYAMVTLVYFDLASVAPQLNGAGQIRFSVKLNSIESTPRNMNIDYIGTFTDMTNSLAKYSAPSINTFSNVLTNSATAGVYSFDVTQISNAPFTSRYAVFRFYQTGYLIGDSTTREYHFSSTLTDAQLSKISPSIIPDLSILQAIVLQWQSQIEKIYQVQSSSDMTTWQNVGSSISGDGSIMTVHDIPGQATKKFYRVQVY